MGKLMRDTITFAVLLLLVLFLGAAAPAAPQPDERRIALVVGNGDYQAGKLQTPALIRQASELALAEGADFLKTSTGKVKVNATPEAVREMLAAIRASGGACGIKVAGGVATMADVQAYVELVREALGEAALTPARLRFGASSLLPVLIDEIEGRGAGAASSGY